MRVAIGRLGRPVVLTLVKDLVDLHEMRGRDGVREGGLESDMHFRVTMSLVSGVK